MTSIRRPGAASAAVLVGLSASMVGAHLIAPEWSRRTGLDVWNYSALEGVTRTVAEERAEMEARAEQEARRRAVADQIAARLISREEALATVAAELTDLFADDAARLCALGAGHPRGYDTRLLYARHAITRVERLLTRDPAQWETVRERLEADYRALEATWGVPSGAEPRPQRRG